MQAFLNAIQAAPTGALFIPPGTYVVKQMLNITRSIVLRGAGVDQTTLLFPHSLTDVYGNQPADARGYSQWSFRPAFINILGEDPIDATTHVVDVTADADRGNRVLSVGNWQQNVLAGQQIRVVQSDPAPGSVLSGSLINHLHQWDVTSPHVPAQVSASELIGRQHAAQMLAYVVNVTAQQIVLDRPLTFDVKPAWQPQLHLVSPTVQQAGIEKLTILFPEVPYAGHFQVSSWHHVDESVSQQAHSYTACSPYAFLR